MSRKNRPQHHEPVEPIIGSADNAIDNSMDDTIEIGDVVLIEGPISDTVEVGTVLMVDGPFEPVPLGTGFSETDDFASEDFASEDFGASPSSKTIVDFGAAANKAQDKVQDIQDKLQDTQNKVQDKTQDMAQNVTQTAHSIADKAQDKAQDIAGKAQDAAQGLADKAQGAAQGLAGKAHDMTKSVADKAQDKAQKVAETASSAKTAVASAGSNSKSFVAGAAGTVGTSLWGLMQRNPLQTLVFLASLVWLIRSSSATASQPAVSVSDAAGDAAQKVGTVAGQVQVAAGNLSSQVQAHAQQGAGWFSKTLQSNPLAIGAMGIVFGAGLGFAVPETSYEHQTLGKTRDALADKAQAAAQDLGHKVQTVAQTAVQEAIDAGKEEAKNQGLTPQAEAPQEQAQQQ